MISESPKLIPVTLNATDTDIEIQYWSNFHQQCFWRKSSPKHFHNENHAIINFFCHETNLSSLPFCVPPNSDTYPTRTMFHSFSLISPSSRRMHWFQLNDVKRKYQEKVHSTSPACPHTSWKNNIWYKFTTGVLRISCRRNLYKQN